MSGLNVNVNDIPVPSTEAKLTPDDVLKVLAVVKRILASAKVVAGMTPSELDDKIVAVLEKFVAVTEKFVNEDWFLSLLNYVFKFFAKNDAVKMFDFVNAVAHSK